MENIFVKKNFILISKVFLFMSFIIMIIHNIEMDLYIKNFIIPSTLLICSFIYLLKKFNIDERKKYYLFLVPIVLILFSYFIVPIDDNNMALNIIVLPIILSMLFIGTTNNYYHINRHILINFFRLFPDNLFSNLSYLKIVRSDKKNKINNNLIYVFIGFLIGLPIVSIILSLLTNSDAYFNVFASRVFDFISNLLSIDNVIGNIIIFVICFIVLFSVFVNILRNRFTNDKESNKKNINSYIVNTILVMVNFIFVLFLLSEISKLTINFLQVPEIYTYAEYAREGFFELLGVTIINLFIIGFLCYYTNLTDNRLVKISVLLLCFFSIVLIFNSYYRMGLYINRFGFTVLRSQVMLFLLMEFIIFLIIENKLINGIKYSEGKIFSAIVIGFYIINLYLCNNSFIDFVNRLFNYI